MCWAGDGGARVTGVGEGVGWGGLFGGGRSGLSGGYGSSKVDRRARVFWVVGAVGGHWVVPLLWGCARGRGRCCCWVAWVGLGV